MQPQLETVIYYYIGKPTICACNFNSDVPLEDFRFVNMKAPYSIRKPLEDCGQIKWAAQALQCGLSFACNRGLAHIIIYIHIYLEAHIFYSTS